MTVLWIGPDSPNGRAVADALGDGPTCSFTVECATQFSDGLERLSTGRFAAVLFDGSVPGTQVIARVEQLRRTAPHIPILAIGSPDDPGIVSQAVEFGALTYLQGTRVDRESLPRTLQHLIGREETNEALFSERHRGNVALNMIGEGVLSVDIPGNVTYLNPVAERMTGWSSKEALGRPVDEVFHAIDAASREPVRSPLDAAIRLDDIVGMTPNCLLVRRDGVESTIENSASPLHDQDGHVVGAVMVFHDVSAALALSLRAVHLAQHDCLTDLPNRMLLNDRLSQAIALATRHRHRVAVLFLDLDRFKHVNDSLGHAIGDALLQSVARRLLTCVRSSDTISRQGGDEFVVLLPQIHHPSDAAVRAQRIIEALVAPHTVAQHQLYVTATIGISISPDDSLDASTLIECADTAMYNAKQSSRNTYQFFKGDMHARAIKRQWIEAGLHRALVAQEFVLHYQPKVNLQTGAITGAEALVRWMHPQRGLIAPADFIPVAEDSGLIVPLGQWVVREACRQARTWIDEGRRPTPVAVNISAAEFQDARFLDHVQATLHDNRLDASLLELELTESSLMRHAESSVVALRTLKDMGVQAAIDDFGTGYSSLSYLRQFPISALKVDQSFVQEIGAESVDSSIVCAVISMARSLGHRVIAEGVETREQFAFLKTQRCGEGQGFYFSPPMVAEQFGRLLGSGLEGALQ